jgi:hypothetical protein
MLRDLTRRILPRRGSDGLWHLGQFLAYPPDFSAEELALWDAVRPYTMTSPERIVAVADAVRYVVDNGIAGDVVECGVWRGGSMMAVAKTLLALGDTSRDLWLFDTYEGMSPPTAEDVSHSGRTADAILRQTPKESGLNSWCIASIEEVAQNIRGTGYPAERIHLVKGKVEDTLPGAAPARIALLRLDTDWYESTRHELVHLWPRLERGGVMIVDDYGHWQGARRAVDEHLATLRPRPMLARVDYTARSCVKP